VFDCSDSFGLVLIVRTSKRPEFFCCSANVNRPQSAISLSVQKWQHDITLHPQSWSPPMGIPDANGATQLGRRGIYKTHNRSCIIRLVDGVLVHALLVGSVVKSTARMEMGKSGGNISACDRIRPWTGTTGQLRAAGWQLGRLTSKGALLNLPALNTVLLTTELHVHFRCYQEPAVTQSAR